jgi:hypothetical protein
MQVSQEILHLLLRENVSEATHFASAQPDDLAHAFVICG